MWEYYLQQIVGLIMLGEKGLHALAKGAKKFAVKCSLEDF